jgi:hypothetical protein
MNKALLVVASLLALENVQAYRIFNETDYSDPYFVPHEQGFTGHYGEPTNLGRERVNEGAPGTATQPREEGASVATRQNCPGMIGPLGDGKYYCLGKEYGYCDRRSGTCFCNIGYQGVDCFECSPTHFKVGSLCYPKKKCPNDCSGAGICDYQTGHCKCDRHRVGVDCAQMTCQTFDQHCTECTSMECRRCADGLFVGANKTHGSMCRRCTEYDPRCTECDHTNCLTCGDPLLLSIRRSGRRKQDPYLPFDELARELSVNVPFGSQQIDGFEEAENFVLTGRNVDLKEVARECKQGLAGDASWNCSFPVPVSHRVCGHSGTLSFSSPTYAIDEGAEHVRITVKRSGGGFGVVEVEYALEHVTTSDADVSPTAHFTSSQRLRFEDGVVQVSFLLTVHEDRVREGEETFRLALRDPTGAAVLGPQRTARVTILDNDSPQTRPDFSTATGPGLVGTMAGTNVSFRVQAVSASQLLQTHGGDRYVVEVLNTPTRGRPLAAGGGTSGGGGGHPAMTSGTRPHPNTDYAVMAASGLPLQMGGGGSGGAQGGLGGGVARGVHSRIAVHEGTVVDEFNGSHLCTWQVDTAGEFTVSVREAMPHGLFGEYFDDATLSSPAFTRVDRQVDFDWGTGRVTNRATDFTSVRWRGKVQGPADEDVTFVVTADDHCRLWIDRVLLIDRWDSPCGRATTHARLRSGHLHDVTIEYRDIRGHARANLAWSSASLGAEATVPQSHLFHLLHIKGSPFSGVVVTPAPTSAPDSKARGAGLWTSEAGVSAHFNVYARDRFRNTQLPDLAAADDFRSVATLQESDRAGEPGGGSLAGSAPALPRYPTTLATSLVYTRAGDGACRRPVGTINATNYGSSWTRDAQLQECVPGVAGLGVEATDRYVAQYTPYIAGTYLLDVTFQQPDGTDGHVDGSPFPVLVRPAPTHAFRSRAWGQWLSFGAVKTAGLESHLRLEAHDLFGNLRQIGGDAFKVRMVHTEHRGAGSIIHAVVLDLGNGTYDCYARPLRSDKASDGLGEYKVHVTLNGVHVADSPYHQSVVPAPVAAQAITVLPRAGELGRHPATKVATSAVPSSFTVEVRDAFDNWAYNAGDVSADMAVTLTGAKVGAGVSPVPVAQLPVVSGAVVCTTASCTVSYTPTSSGEHRLAVTYRGRHIRGSPFDVTVSPGQAFGDTSTCTGTGLYSATAGETARFVITHKDASKNLKIDTFADTSETYNVTVSYVSGNVTGIDGHQFPAAAARASATLTAAVTHLGRGRFEATYTPTLRGKYRVEVSLARTGGQPVHGGPWFPYVSPSAVEPSLCRLSGSGLRGGVAGVVHPVHLDLHDRFGNHLEFGGADPRLYVVYTPHDRAHDRYGAPIAPLAVTDHHNGSYSAPYLPKLSGRWNVNVSYAKQGGLRVEYFDTPDIHDGRQHQYFNQSGTDGRQHLNATVLVEHSPTVDFDWGTGGPSPATQTSAVGLRHDYWGARWSGLVRAPHSENYTFTLTVDDGARLVVDGRVLVDAWDAHGSEDQGSGHSRGIAAPVQGRAGAGADNWSAQPIGHRGADSEAVLYNASMLMVAGRDYAIVLEYQELQGAAALKLEWSSASTERAVVPAEAFSRLLPIRGNQYAASMPAAALPGLAARDWDDAAALDPDTAPADTAPEACVANGPGLSGGVSGERTSFTIEARDRFDNRIRVGGDSFRVRASGNGAARFAGEVTDLGDGTYAVEHTPMSVGTFSLAVTLNTPLKQGAVHTVGGATAVHTDMGEYQVPHSLAHANVRGSPFRVLVTPGATSATASTVSGLGLLAATAGEKASFTIQAKDAQHNRRTSGGAVDDWRVRLSGPEALEGKAGLKHLGGGRYEGSYTAPKRGRYALSVTLNGDGDHVMGSPFHPTVAPTDSYAPRCTADFGTGAGAMPREGAGTVTAAAFSSSYNASSGDPSALPPTFEVQLRTLDRFDNLRTETGDDFVVRVTGPETQSPVVAPRTAAAAGLGGGDSGGGIYAFGFAPRGHGRYQVAVSLANKNAAVHAGARQSGGGGLIGHYYNNQWLRGSPAHSQVDAAIAFNWGFGPLAQAGALSSADYVSVRWSGFLKAEFTEEYTFYVDVDDSARLLVGGRVLVDELGSPAGSYRGKANMTAGALADIVLEYREDVGKASIVLQYSSDRVPKQVVPPSLLFPGSAAIKGSPFIVDVTQDGFLADVNDIRS